MQYLTKFGPQWGQVCCVGFAGDVLWYRSVAGCEGEVHQDLCCPSICGVRIMQG